MANLVFVPGIGGSELFTPPSLFGIGPNIRVWLSYATLLAGGWRWLELAPDGVTPVTPLTGRLSAGRPLSDYYGEALGQWEQQGWRVFAPHLDWRGVLLSDGLVLADLLQTLADDGPVAIVAHSRGGLVVRHALAQLAARGVRGAVSRVACLGTPHAGSFAALALLAGWDDTARLLRSLILGIDSISWPPWLQRDLQRAINSWPAIYELLPNPLSPIWSSPDVDTVYSPSAWADAGVSISAAWLAAAKNSWATLPAVPLSLPWLNVAGEGVATAHALAGREISLKPSGCRWLFSGDGAVISNSAAPLGNSVLVTPTSHRSLPHDGRVVNAVSHWLKTGEVFSGEIAGPILN